MDIHDFNAYFDFFPSYFEQDFDFHKENFAIYILHNNDMANKIKIFLEDISDSPDDSFWKKFAYWGDFFLYDEKKTAKEIRFDYMLLTWDILFPDQVLNQEQTTNLKIWLSSHLSNTECINFDEIISQISAQKDEWKNLNYYNLLRFYHSSENDVVDLQHEIGTDMWCFYLKPASLAGTA